MRCKGLSIIFIGVAFFGSAGSNYRSQTDTPAPDLRLSVRSDKDTYIRGEIVKLTIHLENRSVSRVRIITGPPGKNYGALFYVSRDGTNYGRYDNPFWTQGGSRSPLLEPNGSFEDTSDIMWNFKPETAHLSPMWAENTRRGRILTDYVFPMAGTYRVKAVFWHIVGSDGRGHPESAPIEITVVEPQGEDLIVWRLIENRPDLAYFIQNAWFIETAEGPAARERPWRELRGIADQYPNSVIARQIGQKLQEFRTKLRRPLPWESPN